MAHLIKPLTLSPDAPIDLHMHTTFSDGRWPATQLIDYLAEQGFQLIAVTDHDRIDTISEIQALGEQKNLAVLSGVEMSTEWHGMMGDVLCYGFDPENNFLSPLAENIVRLQYENTLEIYENLIKQGYTFPRKDEILQANDGKLKRQGENIRLLKEHDYVSDWHSGYRIIVEAGYRAIKARMDETVDAAHRSGAVCLIAHPGRREPNFTHYDIALLDQVRAEIPLDGIEVYHPSHNQESIESYLAYVQKHNLLMSTGSDSHGHAGRLPIKHRAEISRRLLEGLGITITA